MVKMQKKEESKMKRSGRNTKQRSIVKGVKYMQTVERTNEERITRRTAGVGGGGGLGTFWDQNRDPADTKVA